MNQLNIGKFISKKRKEKLLIQEQLAEKLGVSNKTVSKWETGKCMPDYSLIKLLCNELGISVSELMDGEEQEPKSLRLYDEEQILDLVERTQKLEKQKGYITIIVYLLLSGSISSIALRMGGSLISEWASIILLIVSIGVTITGLVKGLKQLKAD